MNDSEIIVGDKSEEGIICQICGRHIKVPLYKGHRHMHRQKGDEAKVIATLVKQCEVHYNTE